MRILDIIEKKRDGIELDKDEIYRFIESVSKERVPSYQIAAFLMAAYIKGLSRRETYYLTDAMVASGETIVMDKFSDFTVDKHSTGGVGDKISLIVGPILASLGIPILKMSGRGLGFTGGTLDKLESIPGFRTQLSKEEILRQGKKIQLVLCAQTAKIASADKILYHLRDVTGTIDSIPLIASSIMSKKLAIENDGLVIDLKVGNGAFIHDKEQALLLADTMSYIGEKHGRKVTIVLSSMNEPLGRAIGNSIEIEESLQVLSNKTDGDLLDLSVALAAEALLLKYPDASLDELKLKSRNVIRSGQALETFISMVQSQGGSLEQFYESLKHNCIETIEILSSEDGYVQSIDALTIGKLSLLAGAGRETKEDSINHHAGVYLNKISGEKVNKGDTILTIYLSNTKNRDLCTKIAESAYRINTKIPDKNNIIIDIIRGK
ncbi:MAG: thymidine phosphorylase [Tissierellia bacterium]|nr:thymidine phosphorylase [Tissierellia bacterium]